MDHAIRIHRTGGPEVLAWEAVGAGRAHGPGGSGMSIRQINASYVPQEDRILLRVTVAGGDELRFWLTRASVRDFLPATQAWMAGREPGQPAGCERGADQEVRAFRREAAAARCDFAQDLVPGERLPMGELPVLVARVVLETDAEERVLLHLCDGRLVTLHLGAESLPGILRLVHRIVSGADWGFAVEVPVPASEGAKVH